MTYLSWIKQLVSSSTGRVIKALNNNWHPLCFRCEACQIPLADQGFIKNAGRALCHECNAREKAAAIGKYICFKCHTIVDEGAPLKYKVSIIKKFIQFLI